MAQIFIVPISTSSETASGQYSGQLDTFLVHSVQKGKWNALRMT